MAIGDALKGAEPRLAGHGESLFMLAYRCWHAGFDYSDAECWQYAWNALSNAIGPDEARPVLGAIEDFVRTLRTVARRRLDYYPPPCCRVSECERQVLALVAGLQAGRPDADALSGSLCGPADEQARLLLLARARALAARLADAGITMQTGWASPTPPPPQRSLH